MRYWVRWISSFLVLSETGKSVHFELYRQISVNWREKVPCKTETASYQAPLPYPCCQRPEIAVRPEGDLIGSESITDVKWDAVFATLTLAAPTTAPLKASELAALVSSSVLENCRGMILISGL